MTPRENQSLQVVSRPDKETQVVSRLDLLLGIFAACFSLMCASDESLVPLTKTGTVITQPQTVKENPVIKRNDDANRDIFRRRAEQAASDAVVLRQKQTEKDLTAAVELFQKSVRFFKAADLNGKAADASLQVGEIYFTLSEYDKALSSYGQALHLGAHEPELLCVVLSRMARTYASIGQEAAADKFSTKALQQCNALSDSRLQAEALEARGEVLWNSGDSSKSAEFFSGAQELFEKTGDQDGKARSLLMLAYARFPSNRAEALQFAGKALRLWSAKDNLHGIAEVREELGMLALATDDFETAQCNYELSLPVFHTIGDKDHEAVTLNEIGRASRQTGDLEGSLENYRRAKAVFTTAGDQLGAVEAITGMGMALSGLHQYQPLLSLYRMKLRLARQTRNVGYQASALADLAGVYELQHQYTKAKTLYQRSLAAYVSAKRDYGAGDVSLRLALLYMRQGEYPEALDLVQKALILKEKTGQVEEVAKVYYELANIYRRLNRLAEARTSIEKTIEIIESQRLAIASFDSRASYFSSVHNYYSLYIQILMMLAQQAPEQGFEKLAFEASERSKVRSLLDLLNTSEKDSPCDELLHKQLAVPDSTARNIADTADPTAASPVLTLKQIQSEMGGDDGLLEYALGDEKSYVWVVTANRITAYELSNAEKIERLTQLFRKILTAREPRRNENSLDEYQQRVRRADAAYPEVARQFSQLLLGPVTLPGAKRLLIVPDGPLQYIPFSALPITKENNSLSPLITRYEVVVLPSVSALGTLRHSTEKKVRPTHTAVILADPVVDKTDARIPRGRNSRNNKPSEPPPGLKMALRDIQQAKAIIRLTGSRVEASAIQQALGTKDVFVALDFDASRDSIVQGMLQPYRFVHFATHGIIDARHPEMSGLVLSLINKRGQPQNGYLRLGDIYKLKLSADLVVLSACESALGKDLESEGIIGLPRGFLYAGAKSVIASLWKVDDAAAADLMKGFYARIKQGENPSSALRGAQLEILQGHRWSEPFYWATFVLQGDYQ